MSIASIQAKYPSAIWFDSNYSGTNSGTLAQPYDDLDVAIADSNTNAKVIAIKDGSHTVSQIGGNGGTSNFSFSGTANKLSLVGESTDAVLNFAGTAFGTVINFRGLSTGAIHLETLKVFQNSSGNNYSAIFGANDSASTITIEGCIIELGALTLASTSNYGLIRGAATEVTTLTITDSVILSGSNVNQSTDFGVITTNSSSIGFHTFDCQRNTIINVAGLAHRLVADGSFGTASTYKNNIFVGLSGNNELLGFTPTVSGGNCFHDTGISSGNGGVVFADPQFVDSANGDYRLRPSSPCIGTGVA